MLSNKANLRDLLAATSLIILLKLDSNRQFFSLCDLEIWWMTSKTIGHFFYTMSSFVHHFKSIGECKLELQSGNTQFGLKCPVWPWNFSSILHQALCIISKPWGNSNWSYSPETLNSAQNRQFFVLCDLEIWRMTLKNNRAPLLCCFKLCASFHSH